ncbi:hypothetical protein ACHAWF_010779, partial [Thalassiosira exigua]
ASEASEASSSASSSGRSRAPASPPSPLARPSTAARALLAILRSFLRSFLLPLLLLGTFASLAACGLSHCLSVVHDELFSVVVDRARRTDEDLREEVTYYDRECHVLDITASPDDAWKLIVRDGDSIDDAVETAMVHGAVALPELFDRSLTSELRKYVLKRNEEVRGTEAEYPVSQGTHRISYGIDAAEDPVVSRALGALHAHDKLGGILKKLLGDADPSLTEITVMTCSHGCPDQAWHPDVKPEGHAARFGRTYSHSYSLFVPLQDVTGDMGATDLCPGTHYCSDEWLEPLCEERKVGFHEIGPHGVWRAGDAVLFNQQVWHRGSAHVDPSAPARVVFVVSFIARPRPGDPRQLARGTYFHMKWDMWGHTFRDLADAATSMASPWNKLRCLRLWKPQDRRWGYDLVTSGALQIANGQGAYSPGDLQELLDELDRRNFPRRLWGPADPEDEEAWTAFLRGTIGNVRRFLQDVALTFLAAYALSLAAYAGVVATEERAGRGGNRRAAAALRGGLARLAGTAALVAASTLLLLRRIRTSPWASDVASGRAWMRPFPPAEEARREADPAVSEGPTTVPLRFDVLAGTRLASRTVGAYSRWHDYHPGNRLFADQVSSIGGSLFGSYRDGLPAIFSQALIDAAMRPIQERGGQFLQQDYRTGDWRVMDETETRRFVGQRLLLGPSDSLLTSLKREIDFGLGDYRFGQLRGAAISHASQAHLRSWVENVLRRSSEVSRATALHLRGLPTERESSSWISGVPSSRATLKPTTAGSKLHPRPRIAESPYWSAPRKEELPALRPFAEVFFFEREGSALYHATVLSISEDEWVEIAFYGEGMYDFDETTAWVPPENLVPQTRSVEGGPIVVNYEGHFPARLGRIRPDGRADVLYEDGELEVLDRDFYAAQNISGRHPVIIVNNGIDEHDSEDGSDDAREDEGY